MSRVTLPTLSKPKFGEPCNGCGVCCQSEVCAIGKGAFGPDTPAPCPGLVHDGGRYWCEAVRVADGMGVGLILRLRLGIGAGCDSDD